MWFIPAAEEVRELVGTQSATTYIVRIQREVAQWVALWPIFEVYARGKGYEGRGRRKNAWWWQ